MQPVADRIPDYLHVIRVTIPEHYAVRLPKRRGRDGRGYGYGQAVHCPY